MIVTILVPTYNRAHFASIQLINLNNIRLDLGDIGIEVKVLVSDNHSTPPVVIPEPFRNFVQLIKPEAFLNSGEENLIFAMRQCDGEYVWTLSDDDAPIRRNIIDMFKQILEKKPDFVVANSSAHLKDATVVHSQVICSDSSQIRSLPDFVTRTGIWHVLTGFSGLIVRRETVQNNIKQFNAYFAASKIYSYAMFLLETFWDKKFMFFPQPIVLAAQNEYGDNWSRMAVMENVFYRFFWSTGFVRQIKMLRKAKEVPSGFFASILDQGVQSRFPLLFQMCSNTLEQVLEDTGSKKRLSRSMTQAEFDEMMGFLCTEDPRMMLILAPLIKTQDKQRISSEQIDTAHRQLAYFTKNYCELFYIKAFCGWSIYYFDFVYRATPETDKAPQFRDIAPFTSPDHIISDNLIDMEKVLASQPYPRSYNVQLKVPFYRAIARRILSHRVRTTIYKMIYG